MNIIQANWIINLIQNVIFFFKREEPEIRFLVITVVLGLLSYDKGSFY